MTNPQEVTSTCAEYLATARSVRTMTNSELVEQLKAARLDPSDFTRILDLNGSFGGMKLPTSDPRPSIYHTIGIAPRARINLTPPVSIPFFDFGVAAPCDVEILRSGAVVAEFSNDLPPVEVADTFEVFVEGLALEWLAPQIFGKSDGRQLAGNITDARRNLVAKGRVAPASDRWTTWWQTNDYAARLSAMWGHQRTVQFVVWHSGNIPASFDHLFAN